MSSFFIKLLQEKTKLPGDRVEMTECMFCHPGLSSLVKQLHAVSSKPAFHHHGGRGPKNRRNVKKNKAKQPKDKMSQLAAYFVWQVFHWSSHRDPPWRWWWWRISRVSYQKFSFSHSRYHNFPNYYYSFNIRLKCSVMCQNVSSCIPRLVCSCLACGCRISLIDASIILWSGCIFP